MDQTRTGPKSSTFGEFALFLVLLVGLWDQCTLVSLIYEIDTEQPRCSACKNRGFISEQHQGDRKSLQPEKKSQNWPRLRMWNFMLFLDFVVMDSLGSFHHTTCAARMPWKRRQCWRPCSRPRRGSQGRKAFTFLAGGKLCYHFWR